MESTQRKENYPSTLGPFPGTGWKASKEKKLSVHLGILSRNRMESIQRKENYPSTLGTIPGTGWKASKEKKIIRPPWDPFQEQDGKHQKKRKFQWKTLSTNAIPTLGNLLE